MAQFNRKLAQCVRKRWNTIKLITPSEFRHDFSVGNASETIVSRRGMPANKLVRKQVLRVIVDFPVESIPASVVIEL